jgi:hypothetical protein
LFAFLNEFFRKPSIKLACCISLERLIRCISDFPEIDDTKMRENKGKEDTDVSRGLTNFSQGRNNGYESFTSVLNSEGLCPFIFLKKRLKWAGSSKPKS